MNIFDRMKLNGRVALVTGGERGIGLAICQALAQAGASIVAAGLDEGSAALARELIEKEGVSFRFIRADVTCENDVIAAVQSVRDAEGRLDILVNNAGISKRAEAAEMPLDIWQRVLDINLTGQFLFSREAAKVMLEQGKGAIVNVASMSGLIVNKPLSQCNYNTSKAGVIHMTKSMACEWAKRGIRVNAVAPGYIRTPITEHRFVDPNDPAVPIWREMTPMGHEGVPEDIAGAVLLLASDAASYITGAVLSIDGGYTCW